MLLFSWIITTYFLPKTWEINRILGMPIRPTLTVINYGRWRSHRHWLDRISTRLQLLIYLNPMNKIWSILLSYNIINPKIIFKKNCFMMKRWFIIFLIVVWRYQKSTRVEHEQKLEWKIIFQNIIANIRVQSWPILLSFVQISINFDK